jgi:hypothetical protein
MSAIYERVDATSAQGRDNLLDGKDHAGYAGDVVDQC